MRTRPPLLVTSSNVSGTAGAASASATTTATPATALTPSCASMRSAGVPPPFWMLARKLSPSCGSPTNVASTTSGGVVSRTMVVVNVSDVNTKPPALAAWNCANTVTGPCTSGSACSAAAAYGTKARSAPVSSRNSALVDKRIDVTPPNASTAKDTVSDETKNVPSSSSVLGEGCGASTAVTGNRFNASAPEKSNANAAPSPSPTSRSSR